MVASCVVYEKETTHTTSTRIQHMQIPGQFMVERMMQNTMRSCEILRSEGVQKQQVKDHLKDDL